METGVTIPKAAGSQCQLGNCWRLAVPVWLVVVDTAEDSRTKSRVTLQGRANETATSRVPAR